MRSFALLIRSVIGNSQPVPSRCQELGHIRGQNVKFSTGLVSVLSNPYKGSKYLHPPTPLRTPLLLYPVLT